MEIPKIIHYCWFGGNPLPELAKQCISSWAIFFPDYKIKQWNENNFDLHCCKYVEDAYKAQKWAFVSDYARFFILYQEGGVYFDTDVEVVASFNGIIKNGPYVGCEISESYKNNTNTSFEDKLNISLVINPGLGLAVFPKQAMLKEIMDFYHNLSFYNADGTFNIETVVTYTTHIFKLHGFKGIGDLEFIDGFTVYPAEYFCPINYYTGEITITPKTKSIHHYSESWLDVKEKKIRRKTRIFIKVFGEKIGRRLGWIYGRPYYIRKKVRKYGVMKTLAFYGKKITGNR